jgi:hypothetical protein
MSTATKSPKAAYVPSQEEISRMTAQIRRNWTPQERAARRHMAKAYQQILLGCNARYAA